MNEIRFNLDCTSRIFLTSRWAATQRPCRTCHRPHHRPLTGRPAAATGPPIRRCSTRPHRRWISTSPAPRPPLRRRCLPSPVAGFDSGGQRSSLLSLAIVVERSQNLNWTLKMKENVFCCFYEFIDTFNGIYSVYMLYTFWSVFCILLCLYFCFI